MHLLFTGAVQVTVAVLDKDNTTKSATVPFTYISDTAPSNTAMVAMLKERSDGTYHFVDVRNVSSSRDSIYNALLLAMDASGNMYTVLFPGLIYSIQKITPTGIISTLAGGNKTGYIDGAGATAEFSVIGGMGLDAQGNIYATDDRPNQRIRKITPTGIVSTLAGNGNSGYVDGAGSAAEFNQPSDVAVDAQGNIYVADGLNNCIRKITPAGVVSTLAGDGKEGFVNGTGTNAEFDEPVAIAVDAQGNIYVASIANNCIRKITPAGVVSTFAGGRAGGFADGTGTAAEFNEPGDIAVDAQGNLYVSDVANKAIRKITPTGVVSTILQDDTILYGMSSIAVNAEGNAIYVDGGYLTKITIK